MHCRDTSSALRLTCQLEEPWKCNEIQMYCTWKFMECHECCECSCIRVDLWGLPLVNMFTSKCHLLRSFCMSSAQTAHEKPEFEASNSTALFGSGNAWTAMSISQHLSVWRFENVSCSYHELYKAEKSCTMPCCSECIVHWCIAESCSPRLKTDTEPGFYQLCATQQTLQTFSKHSWQNAFHAWIWMRISGSGDWEDGECYWCHWTIRWGHLLGTWCNFAGGEACLRGGFENGMFESNVQMSLQPKTEYHWNMLFSYVGLKMTARKQSCSNCSLSARISSEAMESDDEFRKGAKDNLNYESKGFRCRGVQRFGVQKRLCCFDTSDLGHSMLTVGHHAAGAWDTVHFCWSIVITWTG